MTRRILHIFLQPNPASDRFERVLREQGWESHPASDCYRGLAELVRRGPGFFDCVVLRFNDLAVGEEEFFPMALKLSRGVPIYFYGDPTGGVTPETARLHGVRGPIEVEVLNQAFGPTESEEAPIEATAPSPPASTEQHANETPPQLSDDELEALLGEDQP